MKRVLFSDVILNASDKQADIPREKLSQEMLSVIKELKAKFYTSQGTVDYESIKVSEEYKKYKTIAANLRDYNLTYLKEDNERLAFWINLFNTIVVDGVIELGITNSVREVMGFFSKIKYLISGQKFSPNDIEHGILRGNKKPPFSPFRQFSLLNPKRRFSLIRVDPRIHFALVCGSRSCAPIKFYTPEDIDNELELAAQSFVNSQVINIIPEEKRVKISMIFKWYQDDFGGREGILDFLCRYLLVDEKREFLKNYKNSIKVEYFPYDWRLNA